MATTLKKITANLMVESVDDTIAFYKNVLGFEVITTVPDAGPFDWAWMKRGDVELMFQSRPSLSGDIPAFTGKEVGGTFGLYINVEGIQSLYDTIKDKVTIVKDMHTTFYGAREFHIQDNSGYLLSFAEDITNA